MSYKSKYQLTTIIGHVTTEEVGKALEEKYGKPEYPADWYDVLNSYQIDWDRYDEQMLEVSKKWPGVVFALDIIGEDQFEVTREYYQNGMTYQATPQPMPEFDPAQLR